MSARTFRLVVAAGVGLAIAFLAGLVTTATASRSQARPAITVIQATFNEQQKTTYYEVYLNDPASATSTWTWDLEPPADDPTCKKFEVVLEVRDRSRAAWHHADSDGCQHKGFDHAGRVNVSVVTGDYSCSATITGTTDHFGPEPAPCFKKPTPPTTTKTTTTSGSVGPPPSKDKPQSQKDKLNKTDAALEGIGAVAMGVGTFIGVVGGIIFTIGGVETASIFGAPAGVPTMVAGGALALVGAGLTGLGKYYAYVAVDPPDLHYTVVATPRVIRLPHASVPPGSSPAAKKDAAAINAALDNTARLVAVLQALRTSVDRAAGAVKKGAAAAAARQRKAVVAYAREAASLMEKSLKLRRAIVAAFGATRTRLVVTPTGMQKMAELAARKGLGAQATTTLRRLGLSPATIRAVQKDVVGSLRRGPKFGFPGVLVNPKADAAELAAAKSLRVWATAVAAH